MRVGGKTDDLACPYQVDAQQDAHHVDQGGVHQNLDRGIQVGTYQRVRQPMVRFDTKSHLGGARAS